MRCKTARTRMIESLFGDGDGSPELDAHLEACARCRGRREEYGRIRRDVASLEDVEVPEELHEVLAQRLEAALAEGPEEGLEPASPQPERPGSHKAAIFIAGMVFLLAVIVAVLVTFGGEYEPPPPAGTLRFAAPGVRIQDPGSPVWREVSAGQSLVPGAALRTEPGGVARVASAGVEWWLAGSSGLRLGDAGTAELVGGRAFVSCDGSSGGEARLVSARGEIRCTAGEFVAAVTSRRLRVACVSGQITVAGEGEAEEQALVAGEATMLTQEGGACRIRSARAPVLTHWLKAFGQDGSPSLSMRQLASVPLDRAEPQLPATVTVEYLACRMHLRGPLALVTVRARLRNEGEQPWEGELCVADLALPAPAAAVPASVRLSAGESQTCQTAGVFVLPDREGHVVLGLSPRAWTGAAVQKVALVVDASAEEGFDELSCPLAEWSVRGEDSVQWAWSGEDLGPDTPVVFEAELDDSNTVDVLRVGEAGDACLLAAWRPGTRKHNWFGRKTNVFVASDLPVSPVGGGAYYGQEVMETILGALPPGCSTALLAWDGKLRVDPRPLSRHLPARVEDMLAALWDLGDGAARGAGDFVRQATTLASAAEGQKLLIFVTTSEPGALDWLEAAGGVPPDLRVAALQLGADRPSERWRRLCEASGGAAMAAPSSMAPGPVAMDFLWNLKWSALTAPAVEVPRTGAGSLLAPSSSFGNHPVVAVLRPDRDGPTGGVFSVRSGGRSRTRQFTIEPGEDVADGELASRLARLLTEDLD